MATITDEKDIAYYLEHPDEVDSTNTELVQKIIAAASDTAGTAGKTESQEDAEAKKAADDAAAKATADAEAAAKAKAEADARAAATARAGDGKGKAAGEVEAPVATKDGKETIPYKVLSDTRDAKDAAEAALRDAMANNLALKRQLEARAAGKDVTDAGGAKAVDDLEEAIEIARVEAPWAVPMMEKLVGSLRDANEKIALLEQDSVETEEQAMDALERQSKVAFEGNATLVLWKSQRPDLFHEAIVQDVLFRSNEKLAQKYVDEDGNIDFAKRYKDCVKAVTALHDGEEVPLPQPIAPSDKKDPPAAGAKAPDPKAVKAAAQAKLDAAAGSAVTTISDLPGGAPAAQSEVEALENESIQSLGTRLFTMTADKLQAFLARNG